jgi:hypothetical protein
MLNSIPTQKQKLQKELDQHKEEFINKGNSITQLDNPDYSPDIKGCHKHSSIMANFFNIYQG